MYKSRILKTNEYSSPLKNIKKKFTNKKKKTIRERDVFKKGSNTKLFVCECNPDKKKQIHKKINVFYK